MPSPLAGRHPVLAAATRLHRRVGTRILAAAGYVAAHALWLAVGWGGAEHRAVIADAFLAPVFLCIALAAWRVARRPALRPRTRGAWRALTLAYLLLWVANVIWFAADAVARRPALLTAGRVLVLASYAPLLAGLLSFPSAPRRLAHRVALALDLATGLVAVALLMWQLVVRPTLERPAVHPLQFVLANVVPAADFAVVVAIAALLYRRVATANRAPLVLLAAGHLLSIAAGVVAAVLGRHHATPAGSWIDGVRVLSGAVTFSAPVVQDRLLTAGGVRRTRGRARPARRRVGRDPLRFIPVLGVALAAGLLLAATRPWWPTPVGVAIFGSVAVMTLVLARQLVALRGHERAERALAESEQRFRTLLEDLHEVVFRTDAVGRLTFLNPAWERLVGRPARESLGRTPADFLHPEDRPAFAHAVRPLLEGAVGECRHEARLVTVAGDLRWVVCHARAMRDPSGAVVGSTGTLADVTGRRTLEDRLRHQAFHDALTGLTNRALFREQLEHALARMRRGEGDAVVLFLDLDGFKDVNDRYGHAAGDEVLVAIGARLVGATRGSDTVARFGGDEFAILLERAPTDADVALVVERVLAEVDAPLAAGGATVRVGASVGVVRAGMADDADGLLRRADDAMYAAKRGGKARWVACAAPA